MLRKKNNVGVDLGHHSVKCAVVDAYSHRIIDLWEGEIFPERESLHQRIQGKILEERVVSILSACNEECSSFASRVVTAIQGEPTICRYFELPVLTNKQLDLAVASEGVKHIPFPVEDLNLSHTLVPPIYEKETKTGVFLVAAKKKSVDLLRSLLKMCGVEIERIEVPALALAREFSRNHKVAKGEFVALVHVGFRLTHVVVVRDGYPYFAIDFPWGGRDLIYAIQATKHVPWGEAKRMVEDSSVTKEGACFEIYYKRLVTELRRCVGFFKSQLPNGSPALSKMVVSGGMSVLGGLADRLSGELGIPVFTSNWNEIRNSRRSVVKSPGVFKVAVGLALEN